MENNSTDFKVIGNLLDVRRTSPSGWQAIKFKSRSQLVWLSADEFDGLNARLEAMLAAKRDAAFLDVRTQQEAK